METLVKYYAHISTVMPLLLKGAALTVQITALSVFFGTIIGLGMSLMKISSNKVLKFISTVYVDFIRGYFHKTHSKSYYSSKKHRQCCNLHSQGSSF